MKTILATLFLFAAALVAPAADSKTAVIGSEIVITVTASGTQPFTYQWYKNGAEISGAKSQTYTIASATLADAGSYSATVVNDAGYVMSDTAVLTLTIVKPTDAKTSIKVTPPKTS